MNWTHFWVLLAVGGAGPFLFYGYTSWLTWKHVWLIVAVLLAIAIIPGALQLQRLTRSGTLAACLLVIVLTASTMLDTWGRYSYSPRRLEYRAINKALSLMTSGWRKGKRIVFSYDCGDSYYLQLLFMSIWKICGSYSVEWRSDFSKKELQAWFPEEEVFGVLMADYPERIRSRIEILKSYDLKPQEKGRWPVELGQAAFQMVVVRVRGNLFPADH